MNLFFITMFMLLINNCNAKANEAKNEMPYGLSKDGKTFFGKPVDGKVSFFLAIAFPKYKPAQEASAPSNQDWLDKLETLENELQGTQVIKQWIAALRKAIRDEPPINNANTKHLLETTVPFLYFLSKAKKNHQDDDVDGMEEVTDIYKGEFKHELKLFKFKGNQLYEQEINKYWLDKLKTLENELQGTTVLKELIEKISDGIKTSQNTQKLSEEITQLIDCLSHLSAVKNEQNNYDITDMQEVTIENILDITQDAVFKFQDDKLYWKERASQDEPTEAMETLKAMGFEQFFNYLDKCRNGKTGAELDNEMKKANGMVAEILNAPKSIEAANKINAANGNKNTDIHLIKIKNNDELIEIYNNLPNTDGKYAFPHFVNDVLSRKGLCIQEHLYWAHGNQQYMREYYKDKKVYDRRLSNTPTPQAQITEAMGALNAKWQQKKIKHKIALKTILSLTVEEPNTLNNRKLNDQEQLEAINILSQMVDIIKDKTEINNEIKGTYKHNVVDEWNIPINKQTSLQLIINIYKKFKTFPFILINNQGYIEIVALNSYVMSGQDLDPVCLIPLRNNYNVISFDNKHPTECIAEEDYRSSLNAINEADAYRDCGDIYTLNDRLQDYKTKYDTAGADGLSQTLWETQIAKIEANIDEYYKAQAALIKKLQRA